MSTPEFDLNDKALQDILQSTGAPPPPSLSTHQFVVHVQARQDATTRSAWELHVPLALSATGALALFFSLQTPQTKDSTPTPDTVIAWQDLEVVDEDTAPWQDDLFTVEAYTDDDATLENLVFADVEISEDLKQEYNDPTFSTVQTLDDDALERLNQILNDALRNRGG